MGWTSGFPEIMETSSVHWFVIIVFFGSDMFAIWTKDTVSNVCDKPGDRESLIIAVSGIQALWSHVITEMKRQGELGHNCTSIRNSGTLISCNYWNEETGKAWFIAVSGIQALWSHVITEMKRQEKLDHNCIWISGNLMSCNYWNEETGKAWS